MLLNDVFHNEKLFFMQKILLTVFTPTYNRAYCLSRLYDSLCRQKCRNFEWLIVDDGSTDETESLVNSFMLENRILIRYIKKVNGGKHTAINCGVKNANGEMFYIVDSDDFVADDSLEFIICEWRKIMFDNSIAGISGCDKTLDGIILSDISRIIRSNSLDIRYRYGIKGDLAEVFKTEILRKYLFPEVQNEKFCPEALVWNRIAADKLKIIYYPKVIKIIEYMSDGLTASIVKSRMQSPTLTTICYGEMLINSCIPVVYRLKAAINYWRFWLCKRKLKVKISIKWFCLFPIGLIMHIRDLKYNKC